MTEKGVGKLADGREADTAREGPSEKGGGEERKLATLPQLYFVTGRLRQSEPGGEITAHERLRGCDWMSEIEQKTEAGRKFLSCHGPPGVERVALLSHRGKDR